jgi:hypothetical protein
MAKRRNLDVIESVRAGKRNDAWATQKHGYVTIWKTGVTWRIQFWQQPFRSDSVGYDSLFAALKSVSRDRSCRPIFYG